VSEKTAALVPKAGEHFSQSKDQQDKGDTVAKTADVVVIGGGINGCSIAFHLAGKGVKRVVLLEKGHIASGPTGRSSGIVRQHYTVETLAKMARDSVRCFEDFAQVVGGDAGFVQAGVVFLSPEGNADALKTTVEMHHRLGIRESILSARELEAMEPALSVAGVAVGSYEPDGGYADPALAANSFAEAAERKGVEVLRRTRVTGLSVGSGQIAGVLTEGGEISTRTVINAAGPWGKGIAAMAGVEIPIYVTRHPVVILQRPARWRTPTPVWVDLVDGWYHKPERNAALMVGSIHNMGPEEEAAIEAHSAVPDYEEIEAFSEACLKRFPLMSEGLAQGGWAGLYDMTPDSQPVIDHIPEVKGFYCAVGFSGHGFKLGPAVGAAMSELVVEGECRTYDLTPFRFERFREGRPTRGAYQYAIIG
jgi:sarcosine oxidase subunit beta